MPIAMRGIEPTVHQVGVGLIPVGDPDRAVFRPAAMPDTGTVHIDIELGRVLKRGLSRMARSDLGAVEVTGAIFAVAGGESVQFQSGKILDYYTPVGGTMEQLFRL